MICIFILLLYRYFCKAADSTSQIYVPKMEACGLWQNIIAAKTLMAFNADSLIQNLNNNFVKSYNSVVVKFVGGKRVKYSLRGKKNMICKLSVDNFYICNMYGICSE